MPIQRSVSICKSSHPFRSNLQSRSNRQECQSSLQFRSNLQYRFNLRCRSSPSVSIQPCTVETEKKKRESNKTKQTECWALSPRWVPWWRSSGPLYATCKSTMRRLCFQIGPAPRPGRSSSRSTCWQARCVHPANGEPRFVKTALSAVIRVDHPNSVAAFMHRAYSG